MSFMLPFRGKNYVFAIAKLKTIGYNYKTSSCVYMNEACDYHRRNILGYFLYHQLHSAQYFFVG